MSNSTEIEPVGGPEWIADNLLPAIPYLVIAITASAVGFCGNVMVLITVVINKNLRHASNVYLVNLACADLLMTGISDPFSIVGRYYKEHSFYYTFTHDKILSTVLDNFCFKCFFPFFHAIKG